MRKQLFVCAFGIVIASSYGTTYAHEPVFGLGPHALFKDGFKTSIGLSQDEAGSDKESELALELAYGVSSNWSVGIEIPYATKDEQAQSVSGVSDLKVFTKYRFWRQDSLGLQESTAVLLALNGQNGDNSTSPPLGNGAVDATIGLTWGYEEIEKYRWVSARYVKLGENNAGLQLGNRWLVDFVIGWRPTTPEYKKPDTVWLLELNGELKAKTKLKGSELANSGGSEWFLSPGIFWTYRNFAIVSGIQIPVVSDLNGNQPEADYRFKISFEWNL